MLSFERLVHPTEVLQERKREINAVEKYAQFLTLSLSKSSRASHRTLRSPDKKADLCAGNKTKKQSKPPAQVFA